MATLHLLGTGASVSEPHRHATMLAFENKDSIMVVDCGSDVIQRLMETGISLAGLNRIDGLIITHHHPDHVIGFPLFMQKIWLAGRTRPIAVYGIAPALDHAQRLFACFDTSGWEGMPIIQWHEIPYEEQALVLENENWRITATPGIHSVPVVGLRVEDQLGKGIVAYSCDTEPSPAIERLAVGANILVHEATGSPHNHSSALDAAQIAHRAGVEQLLLVHLPPAHYLTEAQMEEAQKVFAACEKGEELGRYAF